MKFDSSRRPVFEQPTLILCEGTSDAAFVRALLTHRNGGLRFDVASVEGLSHRKYRGKSHFGVVLQAQRLVDTFVENTKSVILVSDNDDGKDESFALIRQQLSKWALHDKPHFSEPTAYGVKGTDREIAVSIIMLPIRRNDGGIENMLHEAAASVSARQAAAVGDLARSTGVDNWSSQKQSKAMLRALLACTHESKPDIPLSGVWDSDTCAPLIPVSHTAFDEFVQSIENLA